MKKILLILGVCFSTLFSNPIHLTHSPDLSLDFFLYNIKESKAFDLNSESFLAYMAKTRLDFFELQENNASNKKEKMKLREERKKFSDNLFDDFESEVTLLNNKNFMIERMSLAEKNIKNNEFFTIITVKRGKYNFKEGSFPFWNSEAIHNDEPYLWREQGKFFESYLILADENDKKEIHKYFNFIIEKNKAKEHAKKYKDPRDYYIRYVYKIVDSEIGEIGDTSFSKDFIEFNTSKPIIGNSANGRKTQLGVRHLRTITSVKLIRVELLVKNNSGYYDSVYNTYTPRNYDLVYTKYL